MELWTNVDYGLVWIIWTNVGCGLMWNCVRTNVELWTAVELWTCVEYIALEN